MNSTVNTQHISMLLLCFSFLNLVLLHILTFPLSRSSRSGQQPEVQRNAATDFTPPTWSELDKEILPTTIR
ncbi:hypothetical protein KY284_015780 [Solanum tuberosum]|nr:hypothetical protein KY284_015780 [Solanum tuberosum]